MTTIDWAERMANVCYYFPAYTLETAMSLTFPQLYALESQIGRLVKDDPRRA